MLLAGTAAAIAIMADQAIYVIVQIPAWQDFLDLSLIDVGILLSANRFIRLLTNHWAERLVHKVNATAVYVGVLVLAAGVAAMYGTWPIFWMLLVGRILWGLCWSVIRQVGVMTSMDASHESKTGSAMGFYSGLARVGAVVGMLIAGWMCKGKEPQMQAFRYCFWLIGGLSLLAVIPGSLARRGIEGHHSEFRRPREAGSVYHKHGLLICGFVVGFVGVGLIVSTMGFILDHGFGNWLTIGGMVISITAINGAILAMRQGVDAAGGPILGGIVDRMGHKRGMFMLFCIGTGILLAGLAMSFALTATMTIILVGLVMVFFVCATGLQVTLTAEAGRHGSKVYSQFITASDFGAACGPLVAWTMLDKIEADFVPEILKQNAPTVIFGVGTILFLIGTYYAFDRMRREVPANGHA